MSSRERNRIKFYSVNDLSRGWYIDKIEKYVFEKKQEITINDFFEVYNIKLYFENDFYPKNWSDNKKVQYTNIILDTYKKLKEKIFIQYINDDDFQTIFNQLDFIYYTDFWKFFSDYGIYKKLSQNLFKEFLKKQSQQIKNVIYYQKLVKYFNIAIKEFLIDYEVSAQIIIDYEEDNQIFLPKSLTNDDKEEIIKKYLSQNYPQSITYSRLIMHVKNSNSLTLSDKTRLLAKKKYEELNNDLFKKGAGIGSSLSISIDKDQESPIQEEYHELNYKLSIGEKYLKNLKEDIDLFELFEMFFIDNGLINLLDNENTESIFLNLSSKSKNEYAPNSPVFGMFQSRALLIIKMISEYFAKEGKTIEQYIDAFVTYLNIHIQPSALAFTISSKESSYLEKTRHLISEFEAILKQYSLFSAEGEIDYDLIHISTRATPFGEIISIKSKKYIYAISDEIETIKNIFFSKQTRLLPDRRNSDDLYNLFTKETISLEDFKDYQRPQIEKLIDDKYLKINEMGIIKIYNTYIMQLLYELYNYNVINYNHCGFYVRKEIDQLIQEKKLEVENKLFTKSEVSYLNFYMNEKEFTNGHKLHNRYAHGANSYSQEQHEQDYLRIVKVLILVLLKIEDDILDT